MGFDDHNAYVVEMKKSPSTYACSANTVAWKTQMLSSLDISYLMEMRKTLSAYTCAVTMLA